MRELQRDVNISSVAIDGSPSLHPVSGASSIAVVTSSHRASCSMFRSERGAIWWGGGAIGTAARGG